MRGQKLQHGLPYKLVADAAAAQVETMFGIGHADQLGAHSGSAGRVGKRIGCLRDDQMIGFGG